VGLGFNSYDNSANFGSFGKLKGVMHFPYRGGIRSGPTLHELMHNWGNFFLDTGLYSHWNYTGFNSITSSGSKGQLGGYDSNTFRVDDGSMANGGRFSADSFGNFANGGNGLPYNDVELYLMGMIDKANVGNLHIATNPVYHANPADPSRHYFTADKIEEKTFSQLMSDLSLPERVPSSATSQKSFRVLTVLADSVVPTQAEIDDMHTAITSFAYDGYDTSSSYNFYEATQGIGSLKVDEIDLTEK